LASIKESDGDVLAEYPVCSEFAEGLLKYVERGTEAAADFQIARCRELLSARTGIDDDQDIEDILRQAETMACIVVEM
jgi:hypothetical protein